MLLVRGRLGHSGHKRPRSFGNGKFGIRGGCADLPSVMARTMFMSGKTIA